MRRAALLLGYAVACFVTVLLVASALFAGCARQPEPHDTPDSVLLGAPGDSVLGPDGNWYVIREWPRADTVRGAVGDTVPMPNQEGASVVVRWDTVRLQMPNGRFYIVLPRDTTAAPRRVEETPPGPLPGPSGR